MMAASNVPILSSFEFTFCSAESRAELPLKWAKIDPNFIGLGHLLVPELIIKDRDGLNLANSKDMAMTRLFACEARFASNFFIALELM